MAKFDNSVKLALIVAVLFVLLGYTQAYSSTQKVFGSIVGGGNYANGNTINNRGFLLHAVVAGAIVFALAKYQLRI
jgi:hypothetical protein